LSSAPIYSFADGAQARAESAAWAQFSAPASNTDFCTSWLAILCIQVARVNGALVLLKTGGDNTYSPVAAWPDASKSLVHLGPAAEAALKERCGIVLGDTSGQSTQAPTMVGYPIEVDGELHGAVVLDLSPRPDPEIQHALRQLHWGSAWLIDQFRQQVVMEERRRASQLALATEMIATAMLESRLGASSLAVANEMASRLGCERVGVGFEKAGNVKVAAISHTASFDERTDFVRLIGEAMDEVLDLDMPFVHPALQADAVGGLAHAVLSDARNGAAILSVPLMDDGVMMGVLSLERVRERPFNQDDLALCKTVGQLLGPIFALKQRGERGFWARWMDGLRRGSTALFGPRHPGLKLGVLLGGLALVFFSVSSGTYRVASKTVIEGSVQRALVAPFQGYISEGLVRAGESVEKGQVLARLDDRELVLERARWTSEVEQMQRRYRQAASQRERASMAVAVAQIQQAQAQLALVQGRLSRATVLAPFDGIVVQGDLTQLLGSPVEQGKVLFEVAPLDTYRVVLNVDERDIAEMREGQRGELALSGIPHDLLAFTVHQITPISTAQDGRNYFRVEAQLDNANLRLRPGMEGIGKVKVGERKLVWIWTHTFVDWVRLWSWRWFG
jgi:RND family efflux transporter MFP subunit